MPERGRVWIITTLVIAVAALAVSGWTLYRGLTEEKQDYTLAESQEARTQICEAADLVRKGVSLNTNLQPPGGPQDVTGSLAVAANARVALYDGGQYLLARLDPATPEELATEVRRFANGLMDIGAAATTGVQNDDPAQAARLADADEANNRIQELCK